jgi:para-aminobenzoate synthetase component I
VREPDPRTPLVTPEGALVEPFDAAIDVEQAFGRLAQLPHCLYLDSARRELTLGRYSFLSADPFEYFEVAPSELDILGELERRVRQWSSTTIDGLPPFQGGAAGLFGYDLGRSLDRLPSPRFDEFRTAALAIGLYDVVLAIDHRDQRAWIISQGFPEKEPGPRRRRAKVRLEQFKEWLAGGECARGNAKAQDRIPFDELAPQWLVPQHPGLASNFSTEQYLATIRRAIEYIHAGDIFQVNIAQRLMFLAARDSVELYLRLRRRNPATFGGYFDLGETQIVSASPERFLKVHGGQVEARPIKGTRQRTARPEADLFAGDELMQNEKDRAENVMIVDLLRNDLSRVCHPDSVHVTQLYKLESYEYVHHLVSAVCGILRPGESALDLLKASFPGGSITGAPKVRAMQIIAELEPTARGAYCGALGYLGFDGSLDTSILIRTITAARGWWVAPVGGGITAQSVPEREYEETWHKARGLLRAFE